MVFEYKPGGNKPSKPKQLPIPPVWTHDDHDPFPSVETIARQPANERISWLGDVGLYAQQFVSECAALARQYDTLKAKLEDPKLAEHPARRKHVYRADALWEEMVQRSRDALWTIAEADRTWQTLTPEQRAPIAGHWHTPAGAPRLVGVAWYGLTSFETWPARFRLSRLHFNDWPEPLIRDLNDINIWTWQPSPTPPAPDPFGGGGERMPLALARELEGRR